MGINNFVRLPHGPPTQTVYSYFRQLLDLPPVPFVLFNDSQILLLFFISFSHTEDSAPAPVNPCYDGTHTCDRIAQCHPGTGVDYTCTCASGYQGDGRSCVGKSHTLCLSWSPLALCLSKTSVCLLNDLHWSMRLAAVNLRQWFKK